MSTSAPKISTSTQKFIEMDDIRENIVLITGSRACMVLQITATNFSLLSREEQDARMYAYASLLNSLSFPIQILIRNKRVQIEPYLKLLKEEADKTANPKLADNIRQYRDFVEQLVKLTSVLDKSFYIIIPFNSLEGGLQGASSTITGTTKDAFFEQAKGTLHGKAEALLGQIERINLRAKVLDKEDLIKLFYEVYNPENAAIQQDADTITRGFFVSKEKQI